MFLMLIANLFGYSVDYNYLRIRSPVSQTRNVFPQSIPDEYDFIIIGGGTAGCVLANRLTEVKEWNVLLLEAGMEESKLSQVPAFAPYFVHSNIDWHFKTQPDKKSCRSYEGGSWALPQGKIVLSNPTFRGTGGYQSVSHFPYTDRNAKILINAFEELGYKNIDANAKRHIGVVNLQATSKNGWRQSTTSAFIQSIRGKRSNLFIKTQAFVTEVIIDPETKQVKGVEYTSTATRKTTIIMARKEVIMSAGAINSPKILMLCGIGPASELRKHGINVIYEALVGHNFHDHVTTLSLVIKLNKTTSTKNNTEMIKDVHYYLKTGKGPLSSIGPMVSNAFVQTNYEESDNVPDIQYTFGPINSITSGIESLSYFNAIGVYPVLIAPKSRGFIKLNDTDPVWGDPVIYPGYFTNLLGKYRMIEGIKIFRNMFNTTAFEENEYQMDDVPLPNCKQWEFNSDKYWLCVIREYTASCYHIAGSCKMEPKTDREAVVDPKLRVYGINGLRLDFVVHGNTNAPTIMIAEKASDMIKEAWLNKS